MGFFSKLFGIKSEEEREKERIFALIFKYLHDEDYQNSTLLPEIQRILKPKTNMINNGVGDFGYSFENPIPVNGPIGELIYLSKLCTDDNQRITFHRIGSGKNQVDIYEVISIDGKQHDILFFDMYYKGKSNVAPKGYKILKDIDGIMGINSRNDTFPKNQIKYTREAINRMIGIPLVSTSLKNLDEDKLVLLYENLLKEKPIKNEDKEDFNDEVLIDITENRFDIYKIGEKFPLHRNNKGDGGRFEITGMGPSFIMYLCEPSDNEIDKIKYGELNFSLAFADPVIILLIKTDSFLGEGYFSARIYDYDVRDLNNFDHMNVFLVDAVNNELKALRQIELSKEFSHALRIFINKQYEAKFDKKKYDSIVMAIQSQLSFADIWNNSPIRISIKNNEIKHFN